MNRSLTVETNPNGYSPNYKNPYTNMWKDLTEEIVRRLAKKKKRCVFIFLGSKWTDFVNTHKKEISVKGRNLVLVYRHPSANQYRFISGLPPVKGSKLFSKTIKYLHHGKVKKGRYNYSGIFPIS